MRKILLIAAVAALSACTQKAAEPANDANVAMANDAMANDAMAGNTAANATTADAAATMNNSTFEYVRNSRAIQLSVDATGNYISSAGKDHIDHGTAAMKDSKLCFTSAMTKDGEICWTDPKLAVGSSGETVSDKGEKLTVKRVAYIPKTM